MMDIDLTKGYHLMCAAGDMDDSGQEPLKHRKVKYIQYNTYSNHHNKIPKDKMINLHHKKITSVMNYV